MSTTFTFSPCEGGQEHARYTPSIIERDRTVWHAGLGTDGDW